MLNDDCLYHIFFHALPFPVPAVGTPLDHRVIPPLNFSAVCHSWRAVVLSYPALWNNIHIKHVSGSEQALLHPSFLRFVETWISNSADAPLNVDLSVRGAKDDPVRDSIVGRVLSQSPRWREIAIKLYTNGEALDGLVGLPITVRCSPCLISLRLCIGVSRQRAPHIVLDLSACTDANKERSQLSEISITEDLIWRLPNEHHALHLPNLRVLKFCADMRTELRATHRILSASPNLSSLRIFDGSRSVPPSSPLATEIQDEIHEITLSDLFDLQVSSFRGDDTANMMSLKLLDRLTSPSLAVFTFHSSQLISPQHLRRFASFFSRKLPLSGSPLVELELVYPENVDAIPHESHHEHSRALLEMLRLLNRLERLYLWGLIANDELLGALTIPHNTRAKNGSSAKVLCPSLSVLFVIGDFNVGLSEDAAEEMVASRWESGYRLRELSLIVPGFKNFGTRSERMKALVKEGLVV